VTITVVEVNDPPVANNDDADDGAVTNEDQPVTIDVLANDRDVDLPPDTLTVQSVTDPPNGSVANNGTDVTYTPDPDFNGTDTFSYVVSDGQGGTDVAMVTVTVNPVNDPPTANSYNASAAIVDPPQGVVIDVLSNDTDIDGSGEIDPSSVVIAVRPTHGSANPNADGTITYVPNYEPFSEDTFSYTVADIHGDISDPATVTIAIHQPRLFISKESSPDSISPGEQIRFRIAYGNDYGNGNVSTAFDVVLNDMLTGPCTLERVESPPGSIVSGFPLHLDELQAGSVGLVDVYVRASSTEVGTCENTATLTSSNADPVSASASTDIRVPTPTPTATPTPTPTATPGGMGSLAPQGGSPQAAFALLTPLLLFAGPVLLVVLDRGRRQD